MSRIVLAGGTDIAEMVLFSVDDLPSGGADDDTLAAMEGRKQAIRMPTGGDGRYLLHVYVDEDIPAEIKRHCLADDALTTELLLNSGRIAFGGAESAYADYEPNPYIRTDASIPTGKYEAVAFHTEYPDDLVEEAVENAIGPDGKRVEDFTTHIIIGTVGLAFASLILGGLIARPVGFGAAALAVLGGRLWYKSYTGSDKYKRIDALRLEVENEFPSIVVQLHHCGR